MEQIIQEIRTAITNLELVQSVTVLVIESNVVGTATENTSEMLSNTETLPG